MAVAFLASYMPVLCKNMLRRPIYIDVVAWRTWQVKATRQRMACYRLHVGGGRRFCGPKVTNSASVRKY